MKKFLSLTILLLCFIFLSGCNEPPVVNSETTVHLTESVIEDKTGLTLHFIDVGQGDCTLVESKGHFALIDAGEYSERHKVLSYLSKAGVEELDFIISTHPHSDHCGSLSEVIRQYEPGVLISPDAESDSPSWEYVLDAADERDVTYETPEIFDTYQVGAATLTVLSPASDAIYSNLNNYSIVTMIEYGNVSFLLTGDAEALVERQLLRSGYDLSADLLKCGHHGSSTSTCRQFLEAVNPAAAVISCGKNNDYGHPHIEVRDLLDSHNIPVWRTDLQGSITASTDGEVIYISVAGDETVTIEKTTSPTETTAAETTVTTDTTEVSTAYIGNKKSKVFHKTDCGSTKEMSEKNKVNFQSREEAEKAGYEPCGSCNP